LDPSGLDVLRANEMNINQEIDKEIENGK